MRKRQRGETGRERELEMEECGGGEGGEGVEGGGERRDIAREKEGKGKEEREATEQRPTPLAYFRKKSMSSGFDRNYCTAHIFVVIYCNAHC